MPFETHGQATHPTATRPKKHHAGLISFLYAIVLFFSFDQMKAQAEKIGAHAVAPLIASLQANQPNVRVHVMTTALARKSSPRRSGTGRRTG